MTTSEQTISPFLGLADIVHDLSRAMPDEVRFQRLLKVYRDHFPCDAIAILEREEGHLVPRATQGLSPDTMGRRFVIHNHPRLAQILESKKPVRFTPTSELPDPYDGLIENCDGHLYVHDCMGATLYIENSPWGVVTLDALNPKAFDEIDPAIFEAFLAVTAASVHAAGRIHQLESQLDRRQRITLSQSGGNAATEWIGKSRQMEQIRREAETVAGSDLTVLILGETGAGKELVANHLHHHSARAAEPMVYVNCAALPEALAESELFGHVKGAFSGATDNRAGKFELAHDGTLFLDEVGELPLTVQSKLLRTLQNGEIQRIGSDRQHRVNVRLIAATNRDLKKEGAEGRVRADLYHRLSVYPLWIPPLRERPDDILPLAGYFLERDHRKLGIRRVRLSANAKSWLMQYSWPGNVRELEHMLSRAMVRAITDGQPADKLVELTVAHFSVGAVADNNELVEIDDITLNLDITLADALEDFKRRIIMTRLDFCKGNKAAAARSLGIDRGNFIRQLKRIGMD